MDAIKELFNLDLPTFITALFLIMAAIIAIYEIVGKFSDIIGKPVKWVREKNKDHKLLIETAESLQQLKSDHEESVKQSIEHDRVIRESVNSLAEKVDALSDSMNDMKEIQDQDKLAEYKDRIGQSYRFYNARKYSEKEPVPYWNKMEKTSLKDLITQYEAHGGKNSFVHSIVEPECEKWKVISDK